MKNLYKSFTNMNKFLFLLVAGFILLQATSYSNTRQTYDEQNGDWSAQHVTLANTTEADLMVRAGDIDNLGFGWPADFNPFSGESTGVHSFPWTPNTSDAPGTDRIMVISSYDGSPPAGTDGYTTFTSRPENTPRPIVLNYNLDGINVKSATLQIFVDDFQATTWGADYFVSINGVNIPGIAKMVNSLVQTGPIGKLINVTVPQEYLYLIERDSLSILFDDTTTGAGDGYAIDFVKLLINTKKYAYTAKVYGYIIDAVTDKAVKNATISASGIESTISNDKGYFVLDKLPAGIASFSIIKSGYDTTTTLLDLSAGDSIRHDFKIKWSNTIISTTAGGYWNDTLSWIGNAVPTDTNDVIINGPIKGFVHCRNLKISSNGILTNSGGNVYGKLLNNGVVNVPSTTYFNVFGDIENNGSFDTEILSLKENTSGPSPDTHTISGDSLIRIKYFTPDSGIVMIAGSDIKLQTNLKLYYSSFNLGSYNLYLSNSSINNKFSLVTYHANENKIIFTTGKLYLEDASVLNRVSIQGNVEVNNDDNRLRSHVLIWGDVDVKGALRIDNYYNSDTIFGKFTNYGTVDFSSDQNVVYFFDNVENKGVWNDGEVHLAGNNNQNFNFVSDKKPYKTKVKMHVHSAGPYKWFKDGQEISTTADSVLTINAQYSSNWGTYYCEANGTQSREFIIGESTNTLTAAFSADKTSGTAPLTVQFTDQSTGSPASWSWDFGDGATSTDQNPAHTYAAAGDYTVALTVSDGTNSNTETKSNYITVSSSSGSVLLKEHFDGETFPPSGWTQKITNTAHTWKKGNPASHPFTNIDPTNVYSAICPYVAENQDEWLITPSVDLPSGTISLEFYAGYNSTWLSDATVKLNISTDGGANWTKLGEADNDGKAWEWRKVTVDLSEYAGQTIVLAWQYVGNDGDLMAIDNVELTQGTTGIGDNQAEIDQLLSQNYPNPFSTQTRIPFKLDKKSNVRLAIYNSLGQKVAEPVSGTLNAGNHKVTFDASGLQPGIYFYRLVVDGVATTKRMIIMK